MIMAAACKRLAQLRISSGISRFRASKSSSSNSSLRSFSRSSKSNGPQLFFIDTLTLISKLEEQGVSRKQAEAITEYVSKVGMQRTQEIMSKLEAELQRSQMLCQHEIEKLRIDMRKKLDESRNEIGKLPADFEKQLEAAKYDALKYSIGTFVATCAIGLTVLHILN